MDGLIFCILLAILGANAFMFPLATIGEAIWAFVNRTDMTECSRWWQEVKYGWTWDVCDDWMEELWRWAMCDVVLAFVVLFICALLGSIGLLTWLVGIPLFVLGAMYAARYFLDNFND